MKKRDGLLLIGLGVAALILLGRSQASAMGMPGGAGMPGGGMGTDGFGNLLSNLIGGGGGMTGGGSPMGVDITPGQFPINYGAGTGTGTG